MQFPCSSWYNDLNSFTANKQNVRLLDSSASMIFHVLEFSLTLFRMGFSGLLTDGGGGWAKRSLLHIICHTYSAMMKLGTVIPYPRKIHKIFESRHTTLEFCWHQHFFTGNQEILLYQEIQIYIAFWYIISICFNFSWVSIDCIKKNWLKFRLCQQKWVLQSLLKLRHFEIKVITSYILSMTSPTKFCQMTQIILWIWSCDRISVTR